MFSMLSTCQRPVLYYDAKTVFKNSLKDSYMIQNIHRSVIKGKQNSLSFSYWINELSNMNVPIRSITFNYSTNFTLGPITLLSLIYWILNILTNKSRIKSLLKINQGPVLSCRILNSCIVVIYISNSISLQR